MTLAADSVPRGDRRSVWITILGWVVLGISVLLLPISVVTLLMLVAGSHGTASASPLDALIVVLGPLTTAIAGVGLLRRWRWALAYTVVVLAGIILTNSLHLARSPSEPVTTISPSGTRNTVTPGDPIYRVQNGVLIAVSAGLVVVLLSRRVRQEFGWVKRNFADAASGKLSTGAPPSLNRPTEQGRDWRVGHRGRDGMYYEERREGVWQRLEISGEMLTGRAHHVIYFDSPERWSEYPAWARDRRDEIIARIKDEFRAPDYEYLGDAPSRLAPPPVATGSPRTENRPPGIPALSPEVAGRSGSGSHMPRRDRSKPNGAVLIALLVLLCFSAGMGWLVVRGWTEGKTVFPSKRPSQQRAVSREAEPVTFWFTLGTYGALSAGALGFAVWIVRESLRSRPPA